MTPVTKQQTIESFVVEWFVEDADRYERLSHATLPQDRRDWTGTGTGTVNGTRFNDVVKPAIITVVLEVPLPSVDRVTTSLRQGTVRGSQYLKVCAEHADDAATTRDRVLHLERLLEKVKVASRMMAVDAERHRHPGGDGSWTFPDRLERAFSVAGITTGDEIAKVRHALSERKSEVAAKLLAGLPDGDW